MGGQEGRRRGTVWPVTPEIMPRKSPARGGSGAPIAPAPPRQKR
eukprot:COSAG04_NODE_24116_length_327_cov_0.666667_1_plen_43_part_10